MVKAILKKHKFKPHIFLALLCLLFSEVKMLERFTEASNGQMAGV